MIISKFSNWSIYFLSTKPCPPRGNDIRQIPPKNTIWPELPWSAICRCSSHTMEIHRASRGYPKADYLQ